jgi:hypothetical protein
MTAPSWEGGYRLWHRIDGAEGPIRVIRENLLSLREGWFELID